MSRASILLLVTLVMSSANRSLQADEPVFSGPQPSENLSPFKVLGIFGEHAKQELDPVALADGKPTLLVFLHQVNRPSTDVTRVLMHMGQMYQDQGLFCAQIVLDDDVSKTERHLNETAAWWNVGTFLGVSMDGAEGPGSYGLNRNVQLTIILANKGTVTANFPVVQPSLNDVPKIAQELGKLIKVEIPTAQELEFMRAPSQRIERAPKPDRPKEGKGTSDPALRALICNLLRSTGDANAVRDAAKKIDDYVAKNPKRQLELGLASQLIIAQRYGGRPPVVDRVPDQRELFEKWASQDGGLSAERD